MRTLVETRLLQAAAELRAMAAGAQQVADSAPPVAGRPLPHPLQDYLHALSNAGPLAQCWRNTPEQLLYDLIAAVRHYMEDEVRAHHRRDHRAQAPALMLESPRR
jgi:hypothetical protein